MVLYKCPYYYLSTAKLYPLKSEPSSTTSICDQDLIITDGSKCRMFHKLCAEGRECLTKCVLLFCAVITKPWTFLTKLYPIISTICVSNLLGKLLWVKCLRNWSGRMLLISQVCLFTWHHRGDTHTAWACSLSGASGDRWQSDDSTWSHSQGI